MKESWSSRWYAPLVAIGVGVLVLLIIALAIVEVLVASAPPAPSPAGWNAALERAHEAARDGDTAQALSWWQEARREALRSGTWEAMIDVGDASRRLATDAAARRDAQTRAREAYMTALLRARRDHSVDGVLRAAAAFGELGDRAVVAHAFRIAEREAARDPQAREQVRAARWKSRSLEAGHPNHSGGAQP